MSEGTEKAERELAYRKLKAIHPGMEVLPKGVRDALWHMGFEAGLRSGEKWVSINSAPKDGTPILVGWLGDRWEVRRAWWAANFESDYDHDSDTHSLVGAWTDGAVLSFGYEGTASYKPTHWLPLEALPAPPDSGDKQKGDGRG